MIIATNITFLQVSLFLILLIVLGPNSSFADSRIKCRQREWLALLKFKAELIDDYGRLSSWGNEGDDETDCCKWKGVLCDNRTNHVVALDLHGSGDFHFSDAPLRGNISPSLLELVDLNHLDLSVNDFNQSQIPEFIGSLGKLQHLNLSSSNFGGLIPHCLGNLSMLRLLDLGFNWLLMDTNLDWLSGFQSLEYLDLSIANLQRATTWLQAITKLTVVKEIHLKGCELSAALPISLPSFNASNSLVVLDLSHNSLNFTSALLRIINISNSFSYIDFSFNNLEGRIPESLGNLMSLSHLSLRNNNLNGRIPHTLGNLTSLSLLDLSYNNLDGSIPSAFRLLTGLSYLELSHNYIEGVIPDTLGSLMSLSHLDLSYNQLQGEFPRPSKNLSSLRFLDLSGNRLNGQLPYLIMWLWDSTMLEYLDLTDNVLCGSLPNMSRFPVLKELRLRGNKLNDSLIEGNLRLPNLEVLDVSENKFTGLVPNVSSCSSLRWLSLNDNMFNGTLTESIGHLSKVEHLNLGSNHLEGQISEAHLFNLFQLRVLNLSFNSNLTISINSSWNPPFQLSDLMLANCKLGPYFPRWLQKQNQLAFVDISNAKISDTIPYWFWDNTQMCWHLNMSYNQIHGVLPDLSSKVKLLTLDLSSNEFSGSLPLFPPIIYIIDMSRNKFSGTILNFCNFKDSSLDLDLSNNLLSGEIPQACFMNLMSIAYLNLANNNLSGEIPSATDLVCSVYALHLRNNSFTGEISRSLKNCSNLNILDLGENNFTGKIPGWLGESMPQLGFLSLKSNKLYGSLPSSLCHLANLQVLDISANKISGIIPKCLKNFTMLSSKLDSNSTGHDRFMVKGNGTGSIYDRAYIMWKGKEAEYVSALRLLKAIDLSSNNLTGEIPIEVTSLVGLLGLNLSRNNLVGFIPRDIGQLELLNFLDLSKNNLSGGIPPTLSQLSHLGILDLSFNNLSGRIPWDSHLQTFSASAYMGNPGLCGPPLILKPCPEDEMPEKPKSTDNADEDMFITRGFYVSMALGFIVAFWGVFGTLFLNKWWNITILKMFITVGDWLYVKIVVNMNRLQRYFQNG